MNTSRVLCASRSCFVIAAAVATVMTVPRVSRATAPDDQRIADPTGNPPFNTFYSVVNLLTAYNGRTGAFTDEGTGSVIGRQDLGNGEGVLYVLTADHVIAAGSTSVAFGNAGAGGYAANLVFPITNAIQYKTEDVDVIQVTGFNIGFPTKPGSDRTLFFGLTPIQIANPATNPLVRAQPITDYGYGNTGSAVNYTDPTSGQTNPGYQKVDSAGIKRFQNNVVSDILPSGPSPYTPSHGGPYTEPIVETQVVAPANNFGTGSSFGGDSGGPYLTAAQTNVNITRNGAALGISVLSDMEAAVHVGGASVPGAAVQTKINGLDMWAVPIDAGLYTFIQSNIPEPESMGLIALAAVGILRRRRA